MTNQTKNSKTRLIKFTLIFSTIFAFTFVSLACIPVSQTPPDPIEPLTPLTQEEIDNFVFRVVEKMPEFPGGQQAMMKFLVENIRIPVEYNEVNWRGRVILQFVVNTDGSITDIQVIRGVSPLWDKEAIRVIELMPNWIPGEHNGKKVRVKQILPINISPQREKI